MSLCIAAFVTLGLGVELGPKNDWHHFGSEPTGVFGLECQVSERFTLEYRHNSSLFDGVPFGGHDRNTTDVFSVLYRIRLK